MKIFNKIGSLSAITKYRFKTILFIAVFWTIIDTVVVISFNNLPVYNSESKFEMLLLRETIIFFISIAIGYLLIFGLKKLFRDYYLWVAYLIKSIILVAAAFVIHFALYEINTVSILGITLANSFHKFYGDMFREGWLIQKLTYWLILFLITQLIIEINEKYSPGVFIDIFFGKYINPKTENKLIMFIDLKDSTTIAESLDSILYFKFIRDFIFHISNALIENGGRIYQYVGDEIVVSWSSSKNNSRKCFLAVREAKRNLEKNRSRFKRKYGIIPEYRIGIHCGVVTIGEIGVIKKDLAMSGDAMNTVARIKQACYDFQQDFIASKDFIDQMPFKNGIAKSLGKVELKGKEKELELFSIKI